MGPLAYNPSAWVVEERKDVEATVEYGMRSCLTLLPHRRKTDIKRHAVPRLIKRK